MKNLKTKTLFIPLLAIVTLATANVSASAQTVRAGEREVNERIFKQLLTLPYYDVFDHLAFSREGATVTLLGSVVRPTTRSAAEARVRKISGVERVVNRIEVLPLSPFDDDIRVRTYRAVFGTGGLYRYALGANPSVRIVVNRGRVTLEGNVGNRGDSRLAYIAARTVPGVFEVTNNLRVDGEEVRAAD